MQTPTPTPSQFDQLCEPIGEFEYLPAHPAPPAELDFEIEADREQHTLDEQILTGLVSPL